MTARITLSCNATWPGRPPMPCRGAWSTSVDQVADGFDLVDVEDARDLAAAVGWSSRIDPATGAALDYCPAHTRARAGRVLELDPRWAGHPSHVRSAVLELLEDDVAAVARGVLGRLPDREQLAAAGVDPAAFRPTYVRPIEDGVGQPIERVLDVRMTDAGLEIVAQLTPPAYAQLCEGIAGGWSIDEASREPRPSSPACTAGNCPTCARKETTR